MQSQQRWPARRALAHAHVQAACNREAWKQLGDDSPEQAMRAYVALLQEQEPSWSGSLEETSHAGQAAGPVVSTLAGAQARDQVRWSASRLSVWQSGQAATEARTQEKGTSLLDYAERGEAEQVAAALQAGAAVDQTDSSGCSALHLAADRGHLEASSQRSLLYGQVAAAAP